MTKIPNSVCWLIVCGCLLVVTPPATGTTSITLTALNTDGGTTSSATNVPVEDSYTQSVFGDRSGGRWADTTGTVWAQSQTGWLRLNSHGTCATQSAIGSWGGQGRAQARSYWEDRLTVNGGPSRQGQAGEMTATIVIVGSLGLEGGDPHAGTGLANGSGSYFFIQAAMNGLNAKYGANQNFTGGIQLRYVSGGGTAISAYNGNQIGPGTWQVTFPFVFGQQALLYINSQTISDARAGVFSAADGLRQSASTCDFRGGVRWAGITEVRVTNGAVVTDYTITATSAFDYGAGLSASPFGLTQFAVSPAGIAMAWTDSAMRFYTIEKSITLSPGSWAPVSGVTWPITANSIVLPAQSEPRAFFRVRAE